MLTFSRCFFEDNAGDAEACPFKNQDTVFLLVFAIIMLNTDLHKNTHRGRKSPKKMTKADFISNLRGVEDGQDIDMKYLSDVYESIRDSPILIEENETWERVQDDQNSKEETMLRNVRTADSLLRSLAVHDFLFSDLEEFASSIGRSEMDALSHVTRSCVSNIWHQLYGVVNSGMEAAHLDPQSMEPSVEILLYALSITICLDMPKERSAFLCQVGRIREFEERRQGRWVSAPTVDYREESWFVEIEEACRATKEHKIWALQKIQGWIKSLRLALSDDVQNKVEMTNAVAELKQGDFLLDDPSRAFIRSGDLVKRSARSGRLSAYRFYLFSDVLVYGSKDANGQYKVHEELPLHLMKVLDWFPPSQSNRLKTFDIRHPIKNFQVLCASEDDRKSWVNDIRVAIRAETDRKMKSESARLSLYARLQHQT